MVPYPAKIWPSQRKDQPIQELSKGSSIVNRNSFPKHSILNPPTPKIHPHVPPAPAWIVSEWLSRHILLVLTFPLRILIHHLLPASSLPLSFHFLPECFFGSQPRGAKEEESLGRLILCSDSLVREFQRTFLPFLSLWARRMGSWFQGLSTPVPFELLALIVSINNHPPSPTASAAPTPAQLGFSSHSSTVLQSCWTPGRADHRLSSR